MKKETFGDRIRKMRIEKGFATQEEFANIVGVSRVTMNYYENDERKPDYEIFGKIAEALGVSCEYLLGNTETPYKENEATVKKLGLSDRAIKILEQVVNKKIDGISSATVNRLFSNEEAFVGFFKPFELYLQSIYSLHDKIENIDCLRIDKEIEENPDKFFDEKQKQELDDFYKIRSIYEIIPKQCYPYIKHTFEVAMQKALSSLLDSIENNYMDNYLD